MFAVEVYAAVRHFVFIEGNSRREAARVFGLSRETVSKMCRFSLPIEQPAVWKFWAWVVSHPGSPT